MGLNNIEKDDFIKVEESHLNKWRVFDGENWAHGFDYRQQAIDFAQRVGGTRVAFCKSINERVHYVSAEKVRTGCDECDGSGEVLMVATYIKSSDPDTTFDRKEWHNCKKCKGTGVIDMKDKITADELVDDAAIKGRLKALREKNFKTLPYE